MPNPIKDQTRGYKEWGLWEIYVGPGGAATQVYVPNPNDKVFDWTQGYFRVTDVNYTTGISTLEAWEGAVDQGGIDLSDQLLGSTPGESREQYRIYAKLGTLPIKAAVDGCLRIYQANASYIKIFKGTDITNTGQVISGVLNSSGNMISENVGLDLIANINGTNHAIRTPKEFVLTEVLQDNDVVTLVVYSATGVPIGVYKHLIVNTDFVRTVDASKKYVVSVDLVSPWLSDTEADTLLYPVNLPIQSGSLQATVRYSDGSSTDLPVDGVQVELQGMENYVSTSAGQTANLQLVYHLANNEVAVGGSSVPGDRWIAKQYRVRTIAEQGLFSAKLFAIPYWDVNQWKLDWYLYTLARDAVYKVTPYVQDGVGATALNGTNYTTRQTLTKTVNLQDIGMGLPYYQHVQTLFLRFYTAGSNGAATTYFETEYEDGEKFGTGLKAVRGTGTTVGTYSLDLANGAISAAEWVGKLYEDTKPLYAAPAEAGPREPTHFRLKIGSTFSRDIPIGDYNVVQDNINVTPAQGSAVRLEFYRDVSGTITELACSSLVVKV